MKKTVLFLLTLVLMTGFKPGKPAYTLYNNNGKEVSWDILMKRAAGADIILFGELHNNPICHWLQYELTRELYQRKGDSLVLGAEMFETDNQLLLNELIQGTIAERNFEAEARLWPNYKTDYKPLVQFAVENKIPFIATNIPRRYAALVNRKGLEALEGLDTEARALMMPLPVPYDPTLPGYKAMMGMGAHATENLPKAQAVKDATMAWSILNHWDKAKCFLHYHGTYHSDGYEGIYWYLQQYRKGLKILTISSVEQDQTDLLAEENAGKADFTIVIPSSMTKTH